MPKLFPVLVALLLAVPCVAAAETEAPRVIVATGEGSIGVKPDMADVTIGVVNEAATANEALAANAAGVQAVIDRLKAEGIEARDIQTSSFWLDPITPARVVMAPTESRRVTGYSVSNRVSVRVRTLDRLGPVVDRVIAAGANSVSGISFIVSNRDELTDRARVAAIADARRKAALYAAAAGGRVGKILRVDDQTSLSSVFGSAAARGANAQATAIEIGETEIGATIMVTFVLE